MTGLGQVPQLLVFLRKGDAAAGHPTVDPQNGRLQEQVIHTRENLVPIAHLIAQLGDATRVGAALLDGHQIGHIGQLGEHLRGDIGVIAHRVVVEHPRQWRYRGQRAEPMQQLSGIGLVHHRRHDHEPGDAQGRAIAHVCGGRLQTHLGDPAQDRHPTLRRLQRTAHHGPLLVRLQALIFTQRTADHQPSHPGLNQRLKVTRRRREIDRLIGVQVGDSSRENTGPTGVAHGKIQEISIRVQPIETQRIC